MEKRKGDTLPFAFIISEIYKKATLTGQMIGRAWGVAPDPTSFSKRKKQRVFAKLRFAEGQRRGKSRKGERKAKLQAGRKTGNK